MTPLDVISLVLCGGVFVYLCVALLRPEKFQ